MIRSILAVIVGIIAGSAFNMAIIVLLWKLFPMPAGVDPSDSEAFKEYVQSLPTSAFWLVLVAHAGGAIVGGLVAGLIARGAPMILGAIVGGFFLIAGIMNAMSIPAPLWFLVVDLASYLPRGILGAMLMSRR